jgi:uncharacterized protein (TIGR04255 family)
VIQLPEWQRFPKAPITEALLDIRVKLPSDIGLDQLLGLHEQIRGDYPQQRERKSWQGGVALKDGKLEISPVTGGADGYLFSSLDGRQIVQAKLDGFTFNRLAPYDRWETFRDEAKLHWGRYRNLARPTIITRIALRYINRLPLPLPIKDFRDWINTTPEIAPGLPQGLKTFFMRLEIPHPTTAAIGIITETMQAPEVIAGSDRQILPLILDIDVLQEREFTPDSDVLWSTFEDLRNVKNEFFFKSVTDRAKELFQ